MYTETELVRLAKREKNTKRTYLVVNPLQGKHVPVKASKAVEMFGRLAEKLKEQYAGERLLLIGFAETATAIGAFAAQELSCYYMQTTREVIPGAEYFFFSEAHSHATEQKLVKNDLDAILSQVERIIFIEDEVTTGNTILNIIELLKQAYPFMEKYAVASLLNGMDEASQKLYREKEIALHYLVKTDHSRYGELAEKLKNDGRYHVPDFREAAAEEIEIGGCPDARRLVRADAYKEAVQKLCREIFEKTGILKQPYQNILVLGTEELMYPALYLACALEKEGRQVLCHSTTRSPIVVSEDREYPLHERYELRSLYEEERVTFIYDLDRYDCVLILTDAPKTQKAGTNTLVNTLKSCGNEQIYLIRWGREEGEKRTHSQGKEGTEHENFL